MAWEAEHSRARSPFSEADKQWRSQRAEQDQLQNKFYKELYNFPNLFSLQSALQSRELKEALLRRQEEDLKDGTLQYHLEKVRCHNLIIFFKFLLGRKQEALESCETLEADTSKSIIFLTLKAMIQWKFNRHHECQETMAVLHDLYKVPEYEYLKAVAESEKGYLLITIGPKGFLNAMDLFEKAIDTCPNSDIYLWKYDFALAIRRNFNVHVYSEHSKFSPSALGERALTLLSDTVKNCPNESFRGRALIELARLVSHLRNFCTVCDENEKQKLKELHQTRDAEAYFKEALSTASGKEDFYILRECGRQFVYKQDFQRAVDCLDKSYHKRESSMICQLLGRVYRKMYQSNKVYFSPWIMEILEKHQNPNTGIGGSRLPQIHNDWTSSAANTSNEFQDDTTESDEKERERLLAECDHTPYMDKDGNLLTTQAEGFGNICPLPPKSRVSVQRSCSDEEKQRRKLLDEFEDCTYLNADGKFITTQPDGVVGNMLVRHPSKPHFKTSKSYPPSADRLPRSDKAHWEGRVSSQSRDPSHQDDTLPHGKVTGSHTTSCPQSHDRSTPKKKIVRSQGTRPAALLLKSGIDIHRYDAADQRIKIAEYFFLRGCVLNPNNTGLLFDTGTLYEGMKNIEKALDYYHRIVGQQVSMNNIMVVNAYERIGLCLKKRAEVCEEEPERSRLNARAEDMFMTSLVECSKAVVHMPQAKNNMAVLWSSYPQLLEILHQSQPDARTLWKEAKAHELVGKHLKAIDVYQEVMKLARNTSDRIHAFQGTIANHFRMGKTNEARFILDLFLTVEEERNWMLTDMDEATRTLRATAVKIYTQSGTDALGEKTIPEARSAFRNALLMKGKVVDRGIRAAAGVSDLSSPLASGKKVPEGFDLSLHYDEEGPEILSELASCVAAVSRQFFDMRVSVNNEEGTPGQLNFDNELQVAESASLVILLVDSGHEIAPRMRYIANVALESLNMDCVMLIDSGSRAKLPALLRGLRLFPAADTLLALKDGGIVKSPICCLFNFLLGEDVGSMDSKR